jgi:hypothetical protein
MPLVDINYLAVMAATLITFALGALWYSRVFFGRRSRESLGAPPPDEPAPHRRATAQTYFVSLLCHLVTAVIVAVLMSLTGFGTLGQGVLLGFLIWLGCAAPLGLTGNVASKEGIGAWFIDTGYHLVSLLIMGAILGAWRQWT